MRFANITNAYKFCFILFTIHWTGRIDFFRYECWCISSIEKTFSNFVSGLPFNFIRFKEFTIKESTTFPKVQKSFDFIEVVTYFRGFFCFGICMLFVPLNGTCKFKKNPFTFAACFSIVNQILEHCADLVEQRDLGNDS